MKKQDRQQIAEKFLIFKKNRFELEFLRNNAKWV